MRDEKAKTKTKTEAEMKLSEIHLNPKNPRLIKDDRFKKLCQSIKDFPKMLELRPIIIDNDSMILGGNMRFKALKELGYKTIPDNWVKRADALTEAEKQEFIAKDNVPFGEWDWDILQDWDKEKLIEWGIEIPDFAFKQEATEDDYEIPDEIETDIVLGDLIEIGQHRLLCGDSTDANNLSRLMNGQKADITFHSPPYNAGNNRLGGNKHKIESKYANSKDDNVEEWYRLVCDSSVLAVQYSIFAFINVQQLSNNKFKFIDFLHSVKEWFVDEMIWYKGEGNPALAPGVLNSRFEKIIILKNEKFPSRSINTVKFRGTISNVYQGNQQTKNEYSEHHAATFPVHLPAHFISCFTMQSVLDMFIGTGTTMVAAHYLNRKCYGMEIDPKYCQVIIDRMRKLDPEIVIKKNGKIWDGQKQI